MQVLNLLMLKVPETDHSLIGQAKWLISADSSTKIGIAHQLANLKPWIVNTG